VEEIETRQIEGWRRMTAAEKAAIVTGLTNAVYELARAGVRCRYPHASAREQFLRLAIVSLGPELARKAYQTSSCWIFGDRPCRSDRGRTLSRPMQAARHWITSS
jgi:hypothetical protein